jgi:hypothetical protein
MDAAIERGEADHEGDGEAADDEGPRPVAEPPVPSGPRERELAGVDQSEDRAQGEISHHHGAESPADRSRAYPCHAGEEERDDEQPACEGENLPVLAAVIRLPVGRGRVGPEWPPASKEADPDQEHDRRAADPDRPPRKPGRSGTNPEGDDRDAEKQDDRHAHDADPRRRRPVDGLSLRQQKAIENPGQTCREHDGDRRGPGREPRPGELGLVLRRQS